MEPVTHFLTGACLARTGFNRKTALATLTMTLAAEAPDIDVLSSFKDPVFGFAHHRGFTHSFLGLFLVSAAVVALVYAIWRLRGRKISNPKVPPRWGLLYLFAMIAGVSHILLDYTNNYGVRPFWPISEKWYSWDIVFIVEPVMLVLLAGGLIVPVFSVLLDSEFGVRSKGPRGRLAASLALIGVVAMWGVRDYEHRQAVQRLEQDTYEGANPIRVSAYPYWGTPFSWLGVVETQNFIATTGVNSYLGEVDPVDGSNIHFKPEETAVTLAAKQSYLGRVYLDWAKYPITETETTPDGYVVHFRDLRYAYPGRIGQNTLSSSVALDKGFHVVEERFGSKTRRP